MNEPETDEVRIKRLEATTDILVQRLEITNKLLLQFILSAEQNNRSKESISRCSNQINSNAKAIQSIKPCRRKRNDWH